MSAVIDASIVRSTKNDYRQQTRPTIPHSLFKTPITSPRTAPLINLLSQLVEEVHAAAPTPQQQTQIQISNINIPGPPHGAPEKVLGQAEKYLRSKGEIDDVHDLLIQFLGGKKEYAALKVNQYFNKPLHTNKINPELAGAPVIRDYIRVTENNVSLNNLAFNDSIQHSPFASEFNSTVNQLNQHFVAKRLKAALLNPASTEHRQFVQLLNGKTDTASVSRLFNKMLSKRLDSANPNNRLITSFNSVGHRDVVQPVSQDGNLLKLGLAVRVFNSQFGGAIQSGLTMKNPTINSSGKIQGIFASDGAYRGIDISGKGEVRTKGEHKIHFSGLLGDVKATGRADANTSILGLKNTKLWPLRLGGDANIFVLGFSKNSGYQYGKNYAKNVADYRTNFHLQDEGKDPRYSFYTDFNMERFHKILEEKGVNQAKLKQTQDKMAQGNQRLDWNQDIQVLNLTPAIVRSAVQQLVREGNAKAVPQR